MVVEKAVQASVEDPAVQPHEEFVFTRAGLGAASGRTGRGHERH
jgi:hypothetical protein